MNFIEFLHSLNAFLHTQSFEHDSVKKVAHSGPIVLIRIELQGLAKKWIVMLFTTPP